jgi:hypothetical protein
MKGATGRRIARVVASLGIALATSSCAGGGGGSGSQEETLPSSYPGKKIIFVTSMADDGDLRQWMSQCSGRSAGIEAADCICQQHAQIWGNLSGTYKAWLSDSTHGAASRLSHSTVPYVNRKGEQIAANWTELTAAPCSELWNQTETGDAVANVSTLVWTGSDSAGNLVISSYTHGPRTCDDWASDGIGHSGYVGSSGVDSYWPNFPGCWSEWVETSTHEPVGWRDCDLWNHLYCFEQ